jgi:hypothetical protein
MRKLLFSMAAVSALAMAAPAAAQFEREFEVRTDAQFNARLDARIDMIFDRLDSGIDTGAINRTELRDLHREVRTLMRLHRDYAFNGLTQRERADLVQRLRALREDVRMADNGRSTRRYGSYEDDWWDGEDDRVGRGGPYDADGDGWDDRDCDRDGDIDSGACDTRRGGLGGFIDAILNQGGLRVGQRVTGELYAVPYEYRDRYRDTGAFYYRSDGRRIYQIDARTNVVTRVHPMP